jgi:hypothetical protein
VAGAREDRVEFATHQPRTENPDAHDRLSSVSASRNVVLFKASDQTKHPEVRFAREPDLFPATATLTSARDSFSEARSS